MDRDSLIEYINAMIASGDAQTSPLDYDVNAIADDLEEHVDGGAVEDLEVPVLWATVSKHRKLV